MITRSRPVKLVCLGVGLFLFASFAASALVYGVVAELLAAG